MSDAQKYQARKPNVVAMVGTVAVPVTSVTFYHTINTLPYAEFSVALENAPTANGTPSVGGVEINIDNVNQLGKVLQEKIYNNFSLNADVTLTVNDGDGTDAKNNLTFKGFLGNPAFQVTNGEFFLVFTALHSMARLQAFNPQIYQWRPFYASAALDDPFSAYFADTGANARTNSIAQRLLVGINGLMGDFSKNRALLDKPDPTSAVFQSEQTDPIIYEPVQWNVHALNQDVLAAVTQVLTTSFPLTEIDGLTITSQDGGMVQNPNFSDIPLHQTLYNILINSPTIIDALTGVLNAFMFQMNAQLGVDNLWLEHIQTMELPQSMIITPVGALSFSLAAAFEIPILQVIVRGPGSEFYATAPVSTTSSDTAPMAPNVVAPNADDSAFLYDQSLRMLGRYPPTVPTINNGKDPMPGKYVYVDAPAWVAVDQSNLTPDSGAATDPTLDATQEVVNDIKDQETKYIGMSKARLPFLNYLAEFVFKDLFLSRTTARVRIPLCFTPQVGRTYFIKAAGQKSSIYIGYLQSVTHTLKIDTQGGIADTELVFTHIRARTAVLTPMSLGDTAHQITAKQAEINLDLEEAALNLIADTGISADQAKKISALATTAVKVSSLL